MSTSSGSVHGNTKHGHARTRNCSPTYHVWQSMVSRCENLRCSTYKYYGGKGVVICKRWREDFTAFLADMGERPTKRHTIDRIDNSKGYEPGNCQWSTRRTQDRNKSNNRWLTFQGKTLVVADWERELGFQKGVVYRRLERGWEVERALTTPPAKSRAKTR